MSEDKSVEQILAEREQTHGDFTIHAVVTQRIKHAIEDGVYEAHAAIQSGGRALFSNNEKINAIISEAVDMIAHKLGRIAAGDPLEPDHFNDIAGYAKLVPSRIAAVQEETVGMIRNEIEAQASKEIIRLREQRTKIDEMIAQQERLQESNSRILGEKSVASAPTPARPTPQTAVHRNINTKR